MTDRIPQVYLLRLGDTNYFKVGLTINVNERIATLQTATPFDLHLIAALDHENAFVVEKDMHAALKDYHVRNEWFQCEQTEIVRIFEIVSAMAAIDRAMDMPQVVLADALPKTELDRETVDRERDSMITECLKLGMRRDDIREHLAKIGLRTNNDRITELRLSLRKHARDVLAETAETEQ